MDRESRGAGPSTRLMRVAMSVLGRRPMSDEGSEIWRCGGKASRRSNKMRSQRPTRDKTRPTMRKSVQSTTMSTSSPPSSFPRTRDGPAISTSSPSRSVVDAGCLARNRLRRSAWISATSSAGHAAGGTAFPGRYVHVPDPSNPAARTGFLDGDAAVPMGA